jgi:hypothetical protein
MMMGPSPFLLAARAIHVPFTDDKSPIAPSCGALQHRRRLTIDRYAQHIISTPSNFETRPLGYSSFPYVA